MKKGSDAFTILSWNVNGIRAVEKKGFLAWLEKASPEILCLQETKAEPAQLHEALLSPDGYESFWSSAEKKGYSGVATFSKLKPLNVLKGFGIRKFDNEGRIVITEYRPFTVFNIYFPNGKQGPERLKYKMDFYDASLSFAERLRREKKNIVITGDVNTAHKPIDLARPKENEDISGFLPVERKWIDKLVAHGYIDTLRVFHPEPDLYSWWDMKSGARERNVGWRIDYHFVTEEMRGNLVDAFILSDVEGSDHCPVGVTLRF